MRAAGIFGHVGVLVVMAGCTDWDRFSTDYEGPGVCPTYVVAGDIHTCIRKSNGTLMCWGDNRLGQLGTGDVQKRATPTRIALPTAKIYVPTGNGDITSDFTAFTCAIASDTGFYCWGDNRFGQLGLGTNTSSLLPVEIGSLHGKVAKAANGSGHTCVQTTDADLMCWGRNQQGQIGVGNLDPQTSPVTVPLPGARKVERLAAGGDFTCARATDGALFCWGANTQGELGIGTTDPQTTPAEVKTLGARTGRLAVGGGHACVFTDDDGKVWCWGDNAEGQLGTADTERRLVPTPIDPANLGAVKTNQLFAGGKHTCALRDDNSLWCWGGNRYGQLGIGTSEPKLAPTRILGDISAAATGGAHTCAIKTDGSVWCWGNNQYGQLGIEAGPETLTPSRVLPPCH